MRNLDTKRCFDEDGARIIKDANCNKPCIKISINAEFPVICPFYEVGERCLKKDTDSLDF